MKIVKVVALLVISALFTNAYALETDNEKSEASSKELNRSVDKLGNRVEEAVCMESDTECLKQKVKNRAEETTDVVKDKASEIKNKVDE